MNMHIVSVGKLKESYFTAACAEYEKRLGRYCTVEMSEVADEKAPETLSPKQETAVKAAEAERMLRCVQEKEHVIALALGGKSYTSEKFAAHIGALKDSGKNVCFLIGGSLGLGDAALARADERLSLSEMTFPHRIARLVLLEQLYRAFKILANEPYHK